MHCCVETRLTTAPSFGGLKQIFLPRCAALCRVRSRLVASSHAPLIGHLSTSLITKMQTVHIPTIITKKHPIDIDSLQKGDFICQEELAKIVNIDPSNYESFGFAVMGLKQLIENRTDFVLRQINNGLEIMTDDQAVRYLWNRNEKANRDKRKAYEKLTERIDIDNLSSRQLEDYNHKITVVGAEISAASNTRKTIIVSPKKVNL
jgi:hypothetical protein